MLIPMQKKIFDFDHYILRYKYFIKSNGYMYLVICKLVTLIERLGTTENGNGTGTKRITVKVDNMQN